MGDVDDRQETAFVLFLFLAIAVPILSGAVCLLLAGYLAAFHHHNAFRAAFGWLSDYHRDKHGRSIAEPSDLCWEWYLGLVTVYILYEFAELVALVRREF